MGKADTSIAVHQSCNHRMRINLLRRSLIDIKKVQAILKQGLSILNYLSILVQAEYQRSVQHNTSKRADTSM